MRNRPPLWASLSPDELELQYNPQRAVPDFADKRALRDAANAHAACTLRCDHDVAYGDHPLRTLDIYHASAPHGADRPAPVHVYLHGGYWRAQDKANFASFAAMLVPCGLTTVIINYELCPASTLDAVADSAISALAWLYEHIADYGGDPTRISISGNSAGAHLGAELLAADWPTRGLPADIIRGATLTSGIYDPTPARLISVNDTLGLTDEIIARRNLEVRLPRVRCPIALFAGGREPWQWIDQTFRYSHHLRRHGYDPEVHILPGYDHFDILQEYASPTSAIARAILRMAG